jgi:hypothetical protein
MDVWMVVSVLGWMFGWLLVCWDDCWGGWMDVWMVVGIDWQKNLSIGKKILFNWQKELIYFFR